MEQCRRLIAHRKALKTSVSRKLNTLSDYLKHESLNKIAFEDKRASLQDTLHSLRENLKSISDKIMKLPENEFEEAIKDLETKGAFTAVCSTFFFQRDLDLFY